MTANTIAVALAALPTVHDWDSYGGRPTHLRVAAIARAIVPALDPSTVRAVVPLSSGGVRVEMADGTDIEIIP